MNKKKISLLSGILLLSSGGIILTQVPNFVSNNSTSSSQNIEVNNEQLGVDSKVNGTNIGQMYYLANDGWGSGTPDSVFVGDDLLQPYIAQNEEFLLSDFGMGNWTEYMEDSYLLTKEGYLGFFGAHYQKLFQYDPFRFGGWEGLNAYYKPLSPGKVTIYMSVKAKLNVLLVPEWVQFHFNLSGFKYHNTEFVNKPLPLSSSLASEMTSEALGQAIATNCITNKGSSTRVEAQVASVNNSVGRARVNITVRNAIAVDGSSTTLNLNSVELSGFKTQKQTHINNGDLKGADKFFAETVTERDIKKLLPASGLIVNTYNNKKPTLDDVSVKISNRKPQKGEVYCNITLSNDLSTNDDDNSLNKTFTRTFENVKLSGFKDSSGKVTPSGSNSVPGEDNGLNNSSSNTALYIGLGVGGAVLLLLIVALIVYFVLEKKKEAKKQARVVVRPAVTPTRPMLAGPTQPVRPGVSTTKTVTTPVKPVVPVARPGTATTTVQKPGVATKPVTPVKPK